MSRKDDIAVLHVEIPKRIMIELDHFCSFKGTKRQIVIRGLKKELAALRELQSGSKEK